ncbi:hypothetical protein COF61_30750 [Bacillus toyonensis]|nr:transposase [Bacillus toyonensis]PHD54923.1 hypothetical protein COF61_30750 [Bacillus toyonensis]
MKGFAILSNEHTYKKTTFFRKLKRVIEVQRTLSRRKEGSSIWYKQCKKAARVHEHITNARKDYLDKLSTEIIKNHSILGMKVL